MTRRVYTLVAVSAWTGLLLTLVVSASGGYVYDPAAPSLYGTHPGGAAGVLSRVSDTLSYFTIWSTVVVAVVSTALSRRRTPADDPGREPSWWLRALLLDALVMITVTAIVYAVVLAPSAHSVGWDRLTNPILHILTPALMVGGWLVAGPRGWITARVLPGAALVPSVWIVWMLARGAVVHAYPYGFTDVVALGLSTALRNLGFVLLFGLVLAAVFWGVDVLLGRRRTVTVDR